MVCLPANQQTKPNQTNPNRAEVEPFEPGRRTQMKPKENCEFKEMHMKCERPTAPPRPRFTWRLYMTHTIMSGAMRADAGDEAPAFDERGLSLPAPAHGLLLSSSFSPPVPTCVLTALMKSNSRPAPATMPTEGILVTLGASSSSCPPASSASPVAFATGATAGVVVVGRGRARILLAVLALLTVALTFSNSDGSSNSTSASASADAAGAGAGASAVFAFVFGCAEAEEMTLTGEGAREAGGVGT